MKYFTYLSKQVFLHKNTEIISQTKTPLTQSHKHTFTKLDCSNSNLPIETVENISDHISYLHKKHTEELIHEKEMEENDCKCFCSSICSRLLLFSKY